LSLVDGLRFEEDAQLSNDEGALKVGNIGTVSRVYCIFDAIQANEHEKTSVPDPHVFGPLGSGSRPALICTDPDPSSKKFR
jgi:hypothetical protein